MNDEIDGCVYFLIISECIFECVCVCVCECVIVSVGIKEEQLSIASHQTVLFRSNQCSVCLCLSVCSIINR